MNVEIIDSEEVIVVGIRARLEPDFRNVQPLWRERLLPRKAEMRAAGETLHGVFSFIPDPEKGGGDPCECVVGLAVPSLDDIPEGMAGWAAPAGKYARIAASGPAGVIPAYREFLAQWLPQSGYRLAESPVLARVGAEGAEWRVDLPIERPETLDTLKQWMSISQPASGA